MTDEQLAAARAMAERAWAAHRAAQRAVNERLVASTTDGGDQQAADEGVRAGSPAGVETGQVATRTPGKSSAAAGPVGVAVAPTGPYTQAEFDALCKRVWSLSGPDDPTRFDELLCAALIFIGTVALLEDPAALRTLVPKARNLLRSMDERVLFGPDHRVEQP